MKRWLVLLAAALLIGSVKVVYTADVLPMPSTDGVISLLDMNKQMQVCTAVVIQEAKVKDALTVYLALTAKHCITGGTPAQAKLHAGDPGTLKWIGAIKVVHRYEDRDMAIFTFENERELENTWGVAEVSTRPPTAGEVIWAAGIWYWSPQDPQVIAVSSGVWTGIPMKDGDELTYLAVLPVTSGHSGGPVFVDGKVFGILTAGYVAEQPGEPVLTPWSGITVLGDIK